MFSFALPPTAHINPIATGSVAAVANASTSKGSRKPTSAKTRSWEEAQRKARQIEAEHAKPQSTPDTDTESPPRSKTPSSSDSTVSTVREAVTYFLEYKA